MTRVGFTGTRLGMTSPQADAVVGLLLSLKEDLEFHHGDCVGADRDSLYWKLLGVLR